MAKQVNPGAARRGTFLKSFPLSERSQMLRYCADTERAMKRNEVAGEVVYTRIVKWGKRGGDTWQVFLIRKR